jgi:hypothetical protein
LVEFGQPGGQLVAGQEIRRQVTTWATVGDVRRKNWPGRSIMIPEQPDTLVASEKNGSGNIAA